MTRILLSMALVAALAGCNVKLDNSIEPTDYVVADFAVVCLDGTEYWVRKAYSTGFMAVKIDPKTLKPSSCEPRYDVDCVKTGDILTCPLRE